MPLLQIQCKYIKKIEKKEEFRFVLGAYHSKATVAPKAFSVALPGVLYQ